ncbi:hypothetical protein VTK73DRAFT_821 [Phialemonium thermophilum]|uniref:Uncharacterized protein n=1 Tax=Phialemonium thermophilum TaxID=223376 RepID=A0ABR3VU81_9PEZI
MVCGLHMPWLVGLGLLAGRAAADCTVTGLDYTNGGSYLIDASSDQPFTFTSLFQGCDEDTIDPILVSPDGQDYVCSGIDTQSNDGRQVSTCPISFNQMTSGEWVIILQAENTDITVQRSFKLTVGQAEKVTITVRLECTFIPGPRHAYSEACPYPLANEIPP